MATERHSGEGFDLRATYEHERQALECRRYSRRA